MTTSSHERQVLDEVVTPQRHIGSGWREASGGASFPVEDPATGEVLCRVSDATADDAMAALDAACQAQDPWAEHPPRERGEILRRAWQLITDRRDDLALLMTMEMGKPLAESRAEISYGAEFLRWFSEEAVRIDGRWSRDPSGSGRLLTMKQPVGPCLLITPWNFPLAMGTRKIGPAIAAGCTMVLKPAQLTPLSMLALARVLEEVGLPAGGRNVIPSTSASRTAGAVMADPRLRKVSFTGSTPVGRTLMAQASQNLLRMSMELGGNAPFVVFEDADLDRAVEGAVIAKMRNIGESCVAANRFLVAEAVAEEFAAGLAATMGSLRMGRGTEPEADVGPLIDEDQRSKVTELVEDAVGRGGKVLAGGGRREGAGYFFEPTVIGAVPDDSKILSEEVFGPVAPVTAFGTEDEGVARANGTEYGLVAYVFTRDLERALRVVEGLEVGMIGLNRGLVSNPAAPFGGVKQSGFGREGGREGIEEYLSTKYVAVDTGE